MARFLKLVIAIPVAIIILAFALANRQTVTLSFDPFASAANPRASLTSPLFVLLFGALIIGTFLGGVATWFTQGVNRRRARVARDDAERWRDEARRLREQPPTVVGSGGSRLLTRSGV